MRAGEREAGAAAAAPLALGDPQARSYGLAEALRRSAAKHPDRQALVFAQRSWSYSELLAAAQAAAGELLARGVGHGDRVAVLGRNSDAYLIAWLATQLIAAVHVPINFMLGAREVGYILEHSGAVRAFADEGLFGTLEQAVAERGLSLELERLEPLAAGATASGSASSDARGAAASGSADAGARGGDAAELAIEAQTLSQIAYTSGTESAPKGAMLSHGGLQAQYVSCIVAGEYAQDDVVVQALPLYHCAQMHCFMMPSLALGASNVLLGAPAAADVVAAIAEHGATSFFAPPTVWISLLEHPDFDVANVGTLRKAYYGASIMPVATVRALLERLPGIRLYNYYGQTELGPLATCLAPEEQLLKPGSAGRPVLNVQTRVVDDQMRDVAPGEVGEVVHRSPQVTLGYLNDPPSTARAFAGGWFHSGDLAVRDADGFITIVDRKKDMINSGGENVSSREVEEALYEHPAVEEVAVVAIPDPRWIEAVCAIVVLRAGQEASAEELRSFARERLAGFKVPKAVRFIDALPKNPSGKILKRELRELYASEPAQS
ncbi:MAG: fatty acyl-CoA synthetase [Solirubrobacteraceae bacterium]